MFQLAPDQCSVQIHMTLKALSHIFLLNLHYWLKGSFVWLWRYFSMWTLFSLIFCSDSGSCNIRGQNSENGYICMSAPLSRQRNRLAKRTWGWGELSAFPRFADWLPPAPSQEPTEQSSASDCSWWNTHSTWHMHTPQIQSTAMCCVQHQCAKPRQCLDQIQMDQEPVLTNVCNFLITLIEYSECKHLASLCLCSYQGQVNWTAGGWCRQWHLWEPH